MRVAKAMVVTALMVVAGVAHAGDSAKMVLDLRTGPRASGGDETLLFSSLWDGGEGATVTIAQDGVAIAKNLAGEGEQAWSVPYNGTYVLTHVTYTNGVAGKVETAKFVVTGKKLFTESEVKLTGYEGAYDGEGHGIGIETNAIPGLELRCWCETSPSSPSSPSTTLPLFTNVCEATVWVEMIAPGYVPATNSASVKITKAPLTITAKDQTYRYNGMQQGESDPIYATPEEIAEKVIVNGLKGGDTIDHVELGGEATDAGWYPIEPKSAVVVNPNNDDVTGNYTIEYVTGTLTILAPAEVTDVGATPGKGLVSLSFCVTNSPAFGLPDWNAPFLSIVATDIPCAKLHLRKRREGKGCACQTTGKNK